MARLVALDVARTGALVAMATFHLVYDLVLFGHLDPGLLRAGFWPLFARGVAGSFLFLAGVSLWLAQGRGIRWPGFWRRFAKVAAAAALITAGTRVVMPDAFIFFGILHSIAFASLVGLALLRVPVAGLVALALAVVALRLWGQAEVFNLWPLRWVGLGTLAPGSVDYVPPFPWLAPFLLGMAAGRLGDRGGLWAWLAAHPPGPVWQRLAAPGRHSLLVYLLHQPVLIAGVFGVGWLLALR